MKVFIVVPVVGGLRAYVLPNGEGVIIGRLFGGSVDAHYESATLDERSTRLIVSTGGRHLLEKYWGGYVAFLRDRVARKGYVLRDPSGKLQCYKVCSGGVTIFFSSIADLEGLELAPFTVNWRYLAGYLMNDDLRIRESGLNEVTEILAGECVELSGGSERQLVLWDPTRFCRSNTLDHFEAAGVVLRRTTQHCIDAWASVHGRILHSLSGGFDSAVVLGCVVQAPSQPFVICLNRYAAIPGEDERQYARLAASSAGVKLIQVKWNQRKLRLDDFVANLPRAAKPSVMMLGLLDTPLRNQLTRRLELHAYWTGQGGDHLFFQHKSDMIAGDYVHLHGVGRNLVSVIVDGARLSRKSYWAVLRTALRAGFSRKRWTPARAISGESTFLHDDALASVTVASNPWLDNAADLPKGKQWQIFSLADLVNRPTPCAHLELTEEFHPLISQPIMELCLRIPTYLLVKGGRPRALAKAAFKECVPPAILGREIKGRATTYLMSIMRDNAELIRELLLDGVLAREHLLDCKQLEPYVRFAQPIRPAQLFPLLACLVAECWCRSWTAHPQRVSA